MPKYYPVNLLLENKKCTVLGAGSVAERKVKRLLRCGSKVSVISPKISPGLKALLKKKKIVFKKRKAVLKDLSGAYLVISATGSRKFNSEVASYCRRKNILVNVVDSPQDCSFILPAVLSKAGLTIAISTGGVSPALSKRIRQDLEKQFRGPYGGYLALMKKLRPQVMRKIKDAGQRKAFFKKALKAYFK